MNRHWNHPRKFYHFQVEGLGTYSLSAIYASLVLSCMFLPSFVIKKLTVKWAMVSIST